MTRQSLYVHFKTRGGMLVALVRRADEREDIHARFERALDLPDASNRLDAFLGVWFDFVPKIHPVARQLIAARDHDGEATAAWRDRMNDLRRGFLSLSRSLRREGALQAGWTAPSAADYLFAAASLQAWELLAVDCGWGLRKTSATLRRTLAGAVLARD
jgi:AcrR family transcriptional regulator